MVYRVKIEGVITVYSEETLDKLTRLAEDEELFSYISTLVNTGSETNEVLKKLDLLLAGKGQPVAIMAPVAPPIKSVDEAHKTPVERAKPPATGSAAAILNKMKKVNNKRV